MGYSIGEIAAISGITPRQIRLLEEYELLSPARGENGYREYFPQDFFTISDIVTFRSMGFSVAEVRELMQSGLNSETIPKLQQKAEENNRIIKMTELKNRAIQEWINESEFSFRNENVILNVSLPSFVFFPACTESGDKRVGMAEEKLFQEWVHLLPITRFIKLYDIADVGNSGLLGLTAPHKYLDYLDIGIPASAIMLENRRGIIMYSNRPCDQEYRVEARKRMVDFAGRHQLDPTGWLLLYPMFAQKKQELFSSFIFILPVSSAGPGDR